MQKATQDFDPGMHNYALVVEGRVIGVSVPAPTEARPLAGRVDPRVVDDIVLTSADAGQARVVVPSDYVPPPTTVEYEGKPVVCEDGVRYF